MRAPAVYARIGARIRRARQDRQMGQWEIARCLDVTTATVARWESGQSRIGLDQLLTVAAYLGVSAASLLEDPGDHAPQGFTVPFEGLAPAGTPPLEGFD